MASSSVMKKMMHAVQYDSYGGGASSLKHVEIPIPSPKNDEVLLKLEASSLNPVDYRIQSGLMRFVLLPFKFPHVPVSNVSGEVVEVGPGVQNLNIGDKVVSYTGLKRGGGLAEYAVAQTAMTVQRPPEVSAAQGAGLPIAAITALQAVTGLAGIKLDGSGERKNILITAASGGVGTFAVQLAKLGNVHVTATCGARNMEFVKTLGADEVIDYKTPEGASLKSPSGKKYDAVIQGATGTPWSIFEPNLAAHGKVIDLTPGPRAMLTAAIKIVTLSKKSLVPLIVNPKVEELELVVKLVKEGKLKTIVDSTSPLARAEEAWAKSMDGHATGKIIITY